MRSIWVWVPLISEVELLLLRWVYNSLYDDFDACSCGFGFKVFYTSLLCCRYSLRFFCLRYFCQCCVLVKISLADLWPGDRCQLELLMIGVNVHLESSSLSYSTTWCCSRWYLTAWSSFECSYKWSKTLPSRRFAILAECGSIFGWKTQSESNKETLAETTCFKCSL
jgi:hypothetical protein